MNRFLYSREGKVINSELNIFDLVQSLSSKVFDCLYGYDTESAMQGVVTDGRRGSNTQSPGVQALTNTD
jgi:hypothetical protein